MILSINVYNFTTIFVLTVYDFKNIYPIPYSLLIQIFGQLNTILPAENETKNEIPNMQDNNLLSIKC